MQNASIWYDTLDQCNISAEHPMYALLTSYSLTNALRAIYNNLSLQVISQQLSQASDLEQQTLNITENNSLIREVYLMVNETPLVHGKVVIPFITYQAYKDELDALGNKSIGEAFLYNYQHTRTPFQYACIDSKLARRSIFDIQGYKLLITETFLK